MANLTENNLRCLSRPERQELLQEQHQEHMEHQKELDDLVSMYDDIDEDDLYALSYRYNRVPYSSGYPERITSDDYYEDDGYPDYYYND